ncbi:MAG: helix-turn-helix transcriptional regulator [Lachnospiraceae bacterium]|jgi:transcriptional regulator with XRE-family HTH domain|nr:helix-turn-helix transcriptional regulator [Lachnospiraceae bacterium]
MDQIDKNIASNLRRIRKSKNMSLDMLARKTGVSKSMLGQIERGESIPTISTVAKITNGIGISFEELLYLPTASVLVVDNDKLPVVRYKEGAYQVHSFFPGEKRGIFEVFELKIEPGGDCENLSEETDSCEYIIVAQGVLTLKTAEGIYEVAASHAVKIASTQNYCYQNSGSSLLILYIFAAYGNCC